MQRIMILLLSIFIGMLIAYILRDHDLYHGPNANKYSKKIIYSKKNKKCYNFIPTKISSYYEKCKK